MRKLASATLVPSLLALVACGGSVASSGSVDASVDTSLDAIGDAPADAVASDVSDASDATDGAVACNAGTFPSFARACTKDTDCVAVEHEINCCGTQVALGIRADQQSAFAAAEAICRGQYPGCGCASQATTADDGTKFDGTHPARAVCVDSVCTSTFGLASGDGCTPGGDPCGAGLACCYPCGIPGCSNRCEPACKATDPGCSNGCMMRA